MNLRIIPGKISGNGLNAGEHARHDDSVKAEYFAILSEGRGKRFEGKGWYAFCDGEKSPDSGLLNPALVWVAGLFGFYVFQAIRLIRRATLK